MIEKTIYFGSDPEFFVIESKQNPRIISSKNMAIRNSPFDQPVKRDGFLLEFNPSYSTCRETSAYYMWNFFETYKDVISNDIVHNIEENLSFEELDEEDMRLGCTPDYSIYSSRPNIKQPTMLRTAGGHIHVGTPFGKKHKQWYDNNNVKNYLVLWDYERIIPTMDAIVGNTITMMMKYIPKMREQERIRRTLYGKAGDYRPKSYGFEYRVMSNIIFRNYQIMSLAYRLTRLAVSSVMFDKDIEIFKRVKIDNIRKAINNCDYKLAHSNFLKIQPIISFLNKPPLKFINDYYNNKKLFESFDLSRFNFNYNGIGVEKHLTLFS